MSQPQIFLEKWLLPLCMVYRVVVKMEWNTCVKVFGTGLSHIVKAQKMDWLLLNTIKWYSPGDWDPIQETTQHV